MIHQEEAPGGPGHEGPFRHSSKSGVGTALGPSNVWFTLARGTLSEVFHPRVDQPAIHELTFAVVTPQGLVPETPDLDAEVSQLGPGVPAYHVRESRPGGPFRIDKEILCAPEMSVVLQRVRFTPLHGSLADYRLFVLGAPCLDNSDQDNTAWLGEQGGTQMLCAARGGHALALACTAPWLARSVGYAGVSDGWQDLRRHGALVHQYSHAEKGCVILSGEIDLRACNGVFVLALGLGAHPREASYLARAGMLADFDWLARSYADAWHRWLDGLRPAPQEQARTSAAVIRVHHSKHEPGGIVASLSVPWGTENKPGGYHLVWARDLCQAGGGLLAAGAAHEAAQVLDYLRAAQEADGHWLQMSWLDDKPFERGIQLDETAQPVLLFDLLRRHGAIGSPAAYWNMARRAAQFLLQHGPRTEMDRWERDPGISPYTLGSEIAALLVVADLADERGAYDLAARLRVVADEWYTRIDDWLYVADTAISNRVGVPGYYIRVTEPKRRSRSDGAYKPEPDSTDPRDPDSPVVSPDALALVRFGLRTPDDPRVRDTVRVIDALLQVNTPTGPCWHRYNNDHYGEHRDGAPFDGHGVGRAWPLITGERGHFELARGRPDEAARLLQAMESFAHRAGLIPEQIWDTGDIPERGLYLGRPSGSAAPLVWAHAEHLKLWRSLRDGYVFDLPPQTVRRYLHHGHRR